MSVRCLRLGMLLVTAVVIHEASMATSGHDTGMAGPLSTCEPVAGHHHRHHDGREAAVAAVDPVELADACSDLRATARLNREMAPALADVPVTLLADSTIPILFAAISRSIVESPPAHPPDVLRAFFQVYRI